MVNVPLCSNESSVVPKIRPVKKETPLASLEKRPRDELLPAPWAAKTQLRFLDHLRLQFVAKAFWRSKISTGVSTILYLYSIIADMIYSFVQLDCDMKLWHLTHLTLKLLSHRLCTSIYPYTAAFTAVWSSEPLSWKSVLEYPGTMTYQDGNLHPFATFQNGFSGLNAYSQWTDNYQYSSVARFWIYVLSDWRGLYWPTCFHVNCCRSCRSSHTPNAYSSTALVLASGFVNGVASRSTGS